MSERIRGGSDDALYKSTYTLPPSQQGKYATLRGLSPSPPFKGVPGSGGTIHQCCVVLSGRALDLRFTARGFNPGRSTCT